MKTLTLLQDERASKAKPCTASKNASRVLYFCAIVGASFLMSPWAKAQNKKMQAAKMPSKSVTTVVGMVATVPVGTGFEVRGPRGVSYMVKSSSDKMPAALGVGDLVRVYGTMQSGAQSSNLQAANMRVLQRGNLQDLDRAANTIVGVVTMDEAGSMVSVRSDSGTIYKVQAPATANGTYSLGDQVVAQGEWRGNFLQANVMRVLSEGAPPKSAAMLNAAAKAKHPPMGTTPRRSTRNSPRSSRRDMAMQNSMPDDMQDNMSMQDNMPVPNNMPMNNVAANMFIQNGQVSAINNGVFTINTGDGTLYPVRFTNGTFPGLLTVGDYVSVYGALNNGILQASNMRFVYQGEAAGTGLNSVNGILNNANMRADYRNYAGPNRTLIGVVTSNPAGNFFTVRTTDGYSYSVQSQAGKPAAFAVGQKVRAAGTWQDGMLQATSVRITR